MRHRAGVGAQQLLPIPLWNGLRLQLVHSDDVARAIVQIVRRRAFGAFNLAAEPVLTPEWVRMADQAPLVRTTRAHEDLEWWPEHDARDVLREVVTAMGRRV